MRCVSLCPVIRAISTNVSRCMWRRPTLFTAKRRREDSALSATSSPQQADRPALHEEQTIRKPYPRMASAEAITPVPAQHFTQQSHEPRHIHNLVATQIELRQPIRQSQRRHIHNLVAEHSPCPHTLTILKSSIPLLVGRRSSIFRETRAHSRKQ
jgi:hypothetical protein